MSFGGFSFGAPASSAASSSAAPAAASPFSFGNLGAPKPATPAPASAFGGFGAPASSGTSLFGAPAPASGTSLFGQPAPAASGSLFGGAGSTLTSQPQPANPFAASAPGASTSQPAQPAVQLSRTTKFNDLPDPHRKALEDIDTFIQARSQIALSLRSAPLGQDVQRGSALLAQVQHELASLTSQLAHTSAALDALRRDVDLDTQRALIATRVVDGYRKPQEKGGWLKTYKDFPVEYFSEVAEDLRQRLQRYSATLEQVERHLSSHADVPGGGAQQYSPQAIAHILQAQHQTFMSLASSIAGLQSDVNDLKDAYREVWRAKTGRGGDPFFGVSVEGREGGLPVAGLALR